MSVILIIYICREERRLVIRFDDCYKKKETSEINPKSQNKISFGTDFIYNYTRQ